jgi:hypothetical protein
MGARSTTGSVARNAGNRAKIGLFASLAIVAMLAIPATALAGKNVSVTPWISLSNPSGAAAASSLTLGSTVTFAAGYPTNVKNPRVEVLCYQDGQLVFGMAGAVNYAFVLGGGGSIWLDVGGAADCTANLYYFGSKAGVSTYNWLASTHFTAE